MDGATEKEACNPAMDWCRANNIPHILQGGNTPYYTYAIAEDYAASQVASLTSDLRTLAKALKKLEDALVAPSHGSSHQYWEAYESMKAALSLPSVKLLAGGG